MGVGEGQQYLGFRKMGVGEGQQYLGLSKMGVGEVQQYLGSSDLGVGEGRVPALRATPHLWEARTINVQSSS